MAPLAIEIVPCLADNYAYLICDEDSGACAAVDPAEADKVAAAAASHGLKLTHILNTHHHADHTGGNMALKAATGALILGAAHDRARIPGIDVGVGEGSGFDLFGRAVRVLETPGHTAGAVCFVVEDAVFTGDTLFVMGSGRLFEGDAATMVSSLAKLVALPEDAKVHPGHEYALANARFAAGIEPGNRVLQKRIAEVAVRREQSQPVLSTVGLEKATNPFLRTESAEIRMALGLSDASAAEVLAHIRRRKDEFRS